MEYAFIIGVKSFFVLDNQAIYIYISFLRVIQLRTMRLHRETAVVITIGSNNTCRHTGCVILPSILELGLA